MSARAELAELIADDREHGNTELETLRSLVEALIVQAPDLAVSLIRDAFGRAK